MLVPLGCVTVVVVVPGMYARGGVACDGCPCLRPAWLLCPCMMAGCALAAAMGPCSGGSRAALQPGKLKRIGRTVVSARCTWRAAPPRPCSASCSELHALGRRQPHTLGSCTHSADGPLWEAIDGQQHVVLRASRL
eukprot:COSAG01_NODE_1381_length_10520_cov_2.661710_10_plen_136_part_00